jgi:hypothetical protein
LIDCEEDRTLRAVLVGMLREDLPTIYVSDLATLRIRSVDRATPRLGSRYESSR